MRIGIVAGESSGDLLGAGLIAAIREKYPDAIIEGIAGPEMIAQGCVALYPAEKLSLLGLVEVLGHYRELRNIRNNLFRHFINTRPDVFIGIDVPDFNLGLQKKLHDSGIKTVQYVSPQVWAWRKYRIHKIARSIDLVLTLFPFEAEFYKDYSVPVKFVGHPLADMIPLEVDMLEARKKLGLPVDKRIVALLPGSRLSEVKRLLQPFIETAKWCLRHNSEIQFIMPVANKAVNHLVHAACADEELPIKITQGQSRDVMAAADIVLTASGTATLEALLLKKPMIVAYRMAWLSAFFLRRWIKLPYYSLPNLLAGKYIVPEILQKDVSPEVLGPAVMHYFECPDNVIKLAEIFDGIHKSLRQDTNRRAADAVLALIERPAE
jgi:lipid-A-disaccharide synthase